MANEVSAAEKRLILIAAILGSTVVFIDSTVVNVALPAIEDDLGGGLAGQQWTSNAYLVTLSALILIGGSLGDIFGERRIFSLGIAGFALTSLLCALAPAIEVLVVARALQGVFGALLTPAALALIVAAFPADERGKAVGAWTAWGAVGTVVGPLLGGQLVDAASWRWIFAINLPLLAIDFWLIRRATTPMRARPDRARVDVTGSVLCASGLAGVTFALIRQPEAGWGDPTVAIPLIAGVALFLAFLVYEARSSHPMLRLALFRSHNFSVGNLETFTMYAGLSLLFFFLVLFLQQVAGYSATEAGSASVPVTVMMFLLSRRLGGLADRYGPRLFMTVGPLVTAAGLALFVRLDADVSYLTDLLPPLLIFGLGLSLTVAPLTATVLAGADEQNAGIASGVNNAVARVAGLMAVAAVGAVVASSFSASLDDHLGESRSDPVLTRAVEEAKQRPLSRIEPPPGLPAAQRERLAEASEDASVKAFRVGLAISAALVALGGLLGLGIRNPRREVKCRECSGGQLVGAPHDLAQAADSVAARPADTGAPAPA